MNTTITLKKEDKNRIKLLRKEIMKNRIEIIRILSDSTNKSIQSIADNTDRSHKEIKAGDWACVWFFGDDGDAIGYYDCETGTCNLV